MNQQTQVRNVKVKSRAERLLAEEAQLTELPVRKKQFGNWFLQFDNLVRNLAVVGGLVLVMMAVRNSSLPQAQSVFGAIQDSAGIQWDESIGKLSFVNSILPEGIREVWNETPIQAVFAPVSGTVVHAWSREEPYLLLEGDTRDVRASENGEVMSIAHGMEEERIVRLRHTDGTESVYGNLESCSVTVGAQVSAGDIIGKLIVEKPLAFEVRMNGRSVDITHSLKPFDE